MSEHVMIDLETLGKGSHAAIWTIGAVKFNPMHCAETIQEFMDSTERFHVRISMESSFRAGRADASTIDWWMSPDRALPRVEIMEMPELDIIEALHGFREWFGDDKPVWGNGATFDNVILSNAFTAFNIACPWKFRNDRCYRTFRSLAPDLNSQLIGVAHGALSDALTQAWHMQQIVKHVGLKL